MNNGSIINQLIHGATKVTHFDWFMLRARFAGRDYRLVCGLKLARLPTSGDEMQPDYSARYSNLTFFIKNILIPAVSK